MQWEFPILWMDIIYLTTHKTAIKCLFVYFPTGFSPKPSSKNGTCFGLNGFLKA